MARSQPEHPIDAPVVTRRRALPGGRAVVGGLLVVAAAVGAFALAAGAGGQPGGTVVVATRDVAAGSRLGAADLQTLEAGLGDEQRARSFTTAEDLAGAVTLAPMAAGDVVQRSAVLLAPVDDPSATGPEFSFPVERERALDGSLRRGELVDVLATYGSGEGAYTLVVARRAPILDVATREGATLASGGKVVVTLRLASADEVLASAHASEVAAITLVRATRSDAASPSTDRYEPPTPGASTSPTPGPTSTR